MSDYNKINIRFSNFGLNLSHSPTTLPFGKFTVLDNATTELEGQLTVRDGLTYQSSASISGSPSVIGFRRLNDSIRGYSTYIIRAGTSLDCSIDGAGHVTTVAPFNYVSNSTGFLATSFSNNFGSIAIDRTSRSNQVWAYVGDTITMIKAGINASQGVDLKSIGIPRPAGPPTTVQGAGGALTLLGTYFYRYTLYDNNTGVESLFNSVDTNTITLAGANQNVGVTIPTETVNAAVTNARVYRKGGSLSTWSLLSSQSYTGGTISFTDGASDVSIASALLLDELSDQPFTTTNASGTDVPGQPLPYLWGPVNGYLMACGDPQNTGYLYWCNKFNPDSENPNNRVEVTSPQDPLMNGFVFDGKSYVFSKESLFYLVLGLGTSTWTPFQTGAGHGLFANNAFCVGPEVYYLSKDGIYATSGGAERSITADELWPLFNGDSVTIAGHTYRAVDYTQASYCRLAFNNNDLWFQYKATDNQTYCLVYSLVYKRWTSATFAVGTNSLYDDEETTNRFMLGTTGGYLALNSGTADASSSIPVQITTGIISLNTPLMHKEWGPIVFDIDPASTSLTVSIYTDNGTTLYTSTSWNDSTRSRKIINLNDLYAEDITISISWSSGSSTPILYGYEMLYRKDVVQLDRWSITNINHGIDGWQILRSGYITLRSTSDTILTVTADDGASYNYTIPNTNGSKDKVFIPFDPIKGKLFSYILTGSDFRLYNDQCEIHVRPWITSMGYSIANPFTGNTDSFDPDQQATSSSGPGLNSGAGGSGSGGQSTLGGNPFNSDMFSFLGAGGQTLIPPGDSGTIGDGSGVNTGSSNGSERGGGPAHSLPD